MVSEKVGVQIIFLCGLAVVVDVDGCGQTYTSLAVFITFEYYTKGYDNYSVLAQEEPFRAESGNFFKCRVRRLDPLVRSAGQYKSTRGSWGE